MVYPGTSRRSFLKLLEVPSVETIPQDEAIRIAKEFIDQNSLCKVSSNDKFGNEKVIALRRQKLESEKRGSGTLTIYQSVELDRYLFGLRVFGSKQIVHIHPQSSEILGYRSIDWPPVKEEARQPADILSVEELIRRIASTFRNTKTKYTIEKL